jgi:hypothetical protein
MAFGDFFRLYSQNGLNSEISNIPRRPHVPRRLRVDEVSIQRSMVEIPNIGEIKKICIYILSHSTLTQNAHRLRVYSTRHLCTYKP